LIIRGNSEGALKVSDFPAFSVSLWWIFPRTGVRSESERPSKTVGRKR